MPKELYVFLISMIPVVELRAAIPIGAAMGLPWYVNYLLCVIGNMIPVPFILLFIRKVIDLMEKVPKLSKIAVWLKNHAAKKSDKISRYASLGLFLFVAIPIPGTGAWTGSLIASLMELRLKHSLISVFCGVIVAGAIMCGISYGVLGFLDFLV